MEPKNFNRKLSAILSADVKGYSRLMRSDEEATVRTLTEYRALITELVNRYQGRVVDSPGDNILSEFASVVHAVQCAIEIQASLQTRNLALSADRRMEFRIGINLGDVIHDGERIYGDGVNVAARMESLADAGGICVSGSAYDQIENKLSFGCEYLGERTVKNISTPIRVYRLTNDENGGECKISTEAQKPTKRFVYAAVIALLLICGGVTAIWHIYLDSTADPVAVAFVGNMTYPLPDKPSIAILPFENYSDDPKLDFFARGLSEDLTTALSKTSELFVIASTSVAPYKGKSVGTKQVAEEQGVQYVLEGSIQKAGGKLRITVQLVDALNGRHIWANRFDRQAQDILALQDDIVKHVIVELQVELTQGAAARIASRGTDNLDAWLLRIEAYDEFLKFSREGMIRARELYETAHQADPNWSRPIASLASVDWYEAKRGWSPSREKSIQSGIALAEKAIKMDPEAPLGYQTLGNLYALMGQGEKAIEYRRKAAELAPNDLPAIAGLATRLKDYGGEHEAVELFERAMRLSPKHAWWLPSAYGVALHLVGRKTDAVDSYKKAITLKADHVHPHAFLAAVYADLDRMEEARASAKVVLQLNPKFTANRFMQSHSLHDPVRDSRFKNLLVSAGLPG